MNSFKSIGDRIDDAKRLINPQKGGLIRNQIGFSTGIFGGKFTTKEKADNLMNELGYNNYIVTDKGNILFNPKKVDHSKIASTFLNSPRLVV